MEMQRNKDAFAIMCVLYDCFIDGSFVASIH